MNASETAEKLRAYIWRAMEVIDDHKDRPDLVEEGNERIKTYQDAEEAVKKQIPQKPKRRINTEDIKIGALTWKAGTSVPQCTMCNQILSSDKYCRNCGQAIDWSGEDE